MAHEMQLKILLTSEKGQVLMVEYGNVIASQFNKINEYESEPEFLKILSNFMISKLMLMQQFGTIHQRIKDSFEYS